MDNVVGLVRALQPGEKTLFIVDQTEGEKTLGLFTQSAEYVVLDADKLNMKRTVKKQTVASLLEECRFLLTFAMKYGKVLVIRFGLSMTDFKFTFCDEYCPGLEPFQKANIQQRAKYLPRGFMLHSGGHLMSEDMVRALYRRDDLVEMLMDMDDGEDEAIDLSRAIPICHPDFRVVMTTSMPYEKLNDFHFHSKYGLPETRAHFDIRVVMADGKIEQG